ncbi:hypothetical protein [Candidatus Rariloculus sp.]|uniref:hypothetical protein n=1 Tax=Candidatus Rariloculus sp. TaxID=3101265 RepID=UPI003D098CFB
MITKSPIALIALASTATLAQQGPGDGNIPAPNLFDSQVLCTSRLPGMAPTPTLVATGDMESLLDTVIGMGDVRITDRDALDALGYVVPPEGSNCGQGRTRTAFMAATEGSVATDVAAGYSDVLPKFKVIYGDPGNAADTGTAGALRRAQMELARAEANDATSATQLSALRATLARAQETDTEARTEYNAIAQGPIYQAAAVEWMAKADVTQSVADYNTAVTEASEAQRLLDTMNYEGYVPLGNTELTRSVVFVSNGMGAVNYTVLRQYANSSGDTVAEANEDGVWNTSDSNFDGAGNLVVPNRLNNGELEAITQTSRLDALRTNLENHDIALAALKELQEDNLNILLQPVIDETVRRAQAERDYYNTQFQSALADDTNQNPFTVDNLNTPENEAAPYSIASRNAEYLSASNVRFTAETALRNAAAAREAATQDVLDQFNNPESFLAQLVARREALKTTADTAVTDASARGGTASMELTDAVVAAAEALAEAEGAQATYQALVGDPEKPIGDLITTLLKPDGDDGQALVDAISQTYDRTKVNRESIEALTADTENGAEADGPITANTKAIESLDGRVEQNEQDIGTLMGQTGANAGNIVANATNIAANSNNIVTNSNFISQNAGNIAHNSQLIDINAGHIALNSERIGANAAAIGLNSGMIGENRRLIGGLRGQLDAIRSGVAASIALSRMPSIDGGISFGAGMYGGEAALAVGFALERKRTTFDFGVTSAGGDIGAGIGVGVKLWGH